MTASTNQSKPASQPAKPADADKPKDEAPKAAQTPKEPVQAKPEPEVKKINGYPEDEWNKLSLREQKNIEMQDTGSPLRNQLTTADVADHQLLTNAPAQTILAMTGWSMDQLRRRADELEVTLKATAAGDMQPKG